MSQEVEKCCVCGKQPAKFYNRCRECFNEYQRETYKKRPYKKREWKLRWNTRRFAKELGVECSGDCLNCDLPECILPVDHEADNIIKDVLNAEMENC